MPRKIPTSIDLLKRPNRVPHPTPDYISGGFACPKCEGRTAVRDSRSTVDGLIRRRRMCQDCDHKFTTIEVTLDHQLPSNIHTLNTSLSASIREMLARYNNLARALERPVKGASA